MRQLTGEHAAQTPADQQYLAIFGDLIEPSLEQLKRIRLRARIDPEQPRVRAPACPRQRPPQLHRRAVGGEEAGNDQHRRPVLGTARAEWAKP